MDKISSRGRACDSMDGEPPRSDRPHGGPTSGPASAASRRRRAGSVSTTVDSEGLSLSRIVVLAGATAVLALFLGAAVAAGSEVTIQTPENNTTYSTSSVPLNVTSSAAIHEWRYSLDGGPNQTFTPNTTLDGLADGTTHAVTVYGDGVATIWNASYGGGGVDVGTDVAIDTGGNVYVTGQTDNGQTYDIRTMKYGPDGTEVWNVTYDSGGDDTSSGVTVGPNGNVYVVGERQGDFYTIAYGAATGAEQWNASYSPSNDQDPLQDVAVDGAGNVYITGYGTTDSDYYTIKYNATGARQWVRTYSSASWASDRAYGIATDSSGNVYVTGENDADGNVYTIKYDSTGTKQWDRTYDSGDTDFAYDIAVGPSDGIYIAGKTGAPDLLTLAYDTSGSLQWNTIHDVGDSEQARGVAIGPAGGVYTHGLNYNGNDYDYVTTKFDASTGSHQWDVRYDGGGDDRGVGLAVEDGGDVVVTGASTRGGDLDYLTLRYSPGTFSDGPTNFTVDTPEPSVVPNPTGYPGDQTWARSGQLVTLNVTATINGSDIENVSVDASPVNASGTVDLTHAGGDNWTGDVVLDAATSGTYDLNVTANSTAGTVNDTETVGVRVDDTIPVVIPQETDYPAGQDWVRDGQQFRLNVSTSDTYSGVANVTVDVSAINASGTLALSKNAAGYWTGTVTPDTGAATGTYNLTVTGLDGAANANVTDRAWLQLDNTAPSIQSSSTTYPVGQTWVENGQVVTLTASVADVHSGVDNVSVDVSPINSSLGWVEMTRSGGNWTATATVDATTGGTYALDVSATDNATNRRLSTGELSVAVDTDEPGYEWLSRPTRTLSGQDVVVRLQVTDDLALAEPTITVNGTAHAMEPIPDYLRTRTATNRSYAYTIDVPDDDIANVSYSVDVRDAAGRGNTTAPVTLSVGSRTLALRSPVEARTYGSPTVPLNVTTNADVADWHFTLDGGTGSPFQPNASLTGLSDGQHDVTVNGTTLEQTWTATVNRTRTDFASAVAVDSAGNVYVTGQSGTEYTIVKYSPTGTVEWTTSGPHLLTDVAVGPAGDVYASGHTDGLYDMYAVRYDGSTGDEVWNATHPISGGFIKGSGVAVDSAGDVYVTTPDEATIKYDGATGTQLWTASAGEDVALGPSGDLYRAGHSYTYRLNSSTGSREWESPGGGGDIAVSSSGSVFVLGSFRLTKFDSATGGEQWNVTYGTDVDDEAYAAAVGPSGDVYVTGELGDGFRNYYTVRYDGATGTAVWNRSEDRGITDSARGVAVTSSGEVYVTGGTVRYWETPGGDVNRSSNYYTVRYSPTNYSDGPTSFTVDTTPPAVTTIPTEYPGDQSQASDGQQVVVTVSAVDAYSSVASVTVNATAINGTGTVALEQSGGNWSGAIIPDRNAATGTYDLPVVATDEGGNVNDTRTVTVAIDNTPPAVAAASVDYPANQSRLSDGQSASITVDATDTDAGLGTVAVNATGINATGWVSLTRAGGENWTTTLVPDRDAPSGTYNLTIRATDNATNVNATEVVPVVLDNAGPSVTAQPTAYSGGQDWARDGQPVTVAVAISDPLSGVENASVDASAINASGTVALSETAGGNWTAAITPDSGANGTANLTVSAADALGNVNRTAVAVNVDNAAPRPVDRQPAPGATVTDGTTMVRANLSDVGSGVHNASTELWMDGRNVTADATLDPTGVHYDTGSLGDGRHTVSVHLADRLGNDRTWSWTFTVDSTTWVTDTPGGSTETVTSDPGDIAETRTDEPPDSGDTTQTVSDPDEEETTPGGTSPTADEPPVDGTPTATADGPAVVGTASPTDDDSAAAGASPTAEDPSISPDHRDGSPISPFGLLALFGVVLLAVLGWALSRR